MTETVEPTIVALTQGVLAVAQAVAEPVQARIAESALRERQIKWLGVAYESLSFYLVITTRLAQMHGVSVAQAVANAVYRSILPEIAVHFFSRNPPDAQQYMLESFKDGHFRAETAYGACKKLHPEGLEPDPDAILCLFIERLVGALGTDDARTNVQAIVFPTVNGERGLRQLAPLIHAACARATPQN